MCHLPDEITCLQQLTVLDLRDSTRLQSLPEQLGNMSALQELLLRNCNSLERLPSISQLSKLRVIDLSLCDSLQALPSVDLAQLTALTSVGVACCRVLQQLPPWVLEALPVSQQALKLNGLQQITQVPEQLQRLTALTSLDLSGCLRLSQLPDSVSNLMSLQALYLSRTSIAVLPEGFTRLAALQYLDLSNCSELVQLPAELGCLANLAYLDLAKCSELQQLPDSFSMLQLAYVNLPEHFGPQPNSLMTSSQPLEAGAADAVHAAVTRDQSTWGTVTACNANLR
jgi:Leucine-rich repeat (LRR) protein